MITNLVIFQSFSIRLINCCFDNVTCRKFEEITPPHVEDFCYMTDNTYTKEEVCLLLLYMPIQIH